MIDSDNSVSTIIAAYTDMYMPVNVVPKSGGGYDVTCPDTEVPHGLKKVRLWWEMNTAGWKILAVHGLFNPVFPDKSKDGHGFKCKDKNPVADEYNYTVVVGNTTTKEVLLLDPTIKNGGSQ
jgi:hypothetical protein